MAAPATAAQAQIQQQPNVLKKTQTTINPQQISFILTPHKISLLLLLQEIMNRESDATIQDKNSLILFVVDQIKNLQNEISLRELITKIDSTVQNGGHFASELFRCYQSFVSPDELHEFMKSISNWLERVDVSIYASALDRGSLFGLFIRKAKLHFETLSFDGFSKLFSSLQQYLRDTQLPPKAEETKDKNVNTDMYSSTSFVLPQSSSTTQSRTLFTNFLSSLQNNEYDTALELLHKYFDNSDDSNLLCYSILNLSFFHFQFGHIPSALEAIYECIRVSQERNNDECLSYALSLLFRITENSNSRSARSFTYESRKELLQRCITRSRTLDIFYLLSLNNLALAQHTLIHLQTQQTPPSAKVIWDAIQQGIKANFATQYHKQLEEQTMLLKVSAWSLFGSKNLSNTTSQMLMLQNANSNSLVSFISQCRLAIELMEDGKTPQALKLLQSLKTQQSKNQIAHLSHVWNHTFYSILFQNAISSSNHIWMRHYFNQLSSLSFNATSSVSNYSLHRMHTVFQNASVFLHTGRTQEALFLVQQLLLESTKNKFHTESVVYLLMFAEIHQRSNSPISALPYVLSALHLSSSLSLTKIYIETVVFFSEILLSLSEWKKALHILDQIQSKLRETSLFVQASCRFVRAKCILYSLSKNEDISKLFQVIEQISSSEKSFVQLNNVRKSRECAHLLAILYNRVNQTKQRDLWAQKFRLYDETIRLGRQEQYSVSNLINKQNPNNNMNNNNQISEWKNIGVAFSVKKELHDFYFINSETLASLFQQQ